MTLPSTPARAAAAAHLPVGEALAWLRGDRSAPPSFAPAVQAAAAADAWSTGGAALLALEERSLAGDSSAARALAVVHATARALAEATPASVAVASSTPLRDRVVASAAARVAGAVPVAGASPAQLPERGALAPVVAVGLRHALRAEEPARHAAIAALGAGVRDGDPVLEQVLDRLAALLDFPLLVVSIVDGGETVHRAFRCTLPAAAPRVVPREASFCTHCVADGAPLVIVDAAADPFFCRHPAVAAFGLVSYCGVPLRSTSGAVLGTLCGYHVVPRDHAIDDVALLEVFARRVVAVIERRDDPAILDEEASRRAGVDLYAAPVFAELLEVARWRAASGRPTTSFVGAPGALLLAVDARLVGGRLADGRPAWLLAGADPATVASLTAALSAATGGPVVAAAVGDDAPA